MKTFNVELKPAFKLTRQYYEGRLVAAYIYTRVDLELELIDAQAQLAQHKEGERDNLEYENKRLERVRKQIEYIDTRLDWFRNNEA